jgi:hypothetical protein
LNFSTNIEFFAERRNNTDRAENIFDSLKGAKDTTGCGFGGYLVNGLKVKLKKIDA